MKRKRLGKGESLVLGHEYLMRNRYSYESPMSIARRKAETEFSPDQPTDTVTTSVANYLAARKVRKRFI